MGKAEILMNGKDVVIIAVGNTVNSSLKAAEMLRIDGIEPCVINARFIKPLDEELIISKAKRIKNIIIVEENVIAGGFGSAVLECLNKAGIANAQVKIIGINDKFIEHGSQKTLRNKYGIDEDGIYKHALKLLSIS
jgi:1-deoxy-D-xylulose-5-phosphate synthase